MKHALIALALILAPSLAHAADEPNYFVNLNVGVFKNFTSFFNDVQFDYGGKVARKVTSLETFSDLWLALAVNRTSANPSGLVSTSNTELMVQPLFTNVSGTGLYFAPQAGINFIGLGTTTTNEFAYGALVGWSIPLSDTLSFSPEANLTRFSDFGSSQTAVKLLAGVNLKL